MILLILGDQPKNTKLTLKDLEEKTGYRYQTLSTNIQQLVILGYITKHFRSTGRNGVEFSFNSYKPSEEAIKAIKKEQAALRKKLGMLSPKDVEDEPETIIREVKKPIAKLEPEHMETFLRRWAQAKWEPKIFKSARNLPLSVARLYELAIDVGYGGVVAQSDIDAAYIDLEKFKEDLTNTLRIVEGVLAIKKIRGGAELFKYLIHEGGNVQDFTNLVQAVKELN